MSPIYNPTSPTAPLGAQGANTNTDNLPLGMRNFLSTVNPAEIDDDRMGGTTPTQGQAGQFRRWADNLGPNDEPMTQQPTGQPFSLPPQQQPPSMQQMTLPPMQAGSSGNMGNANGGLGSLGGGQQKLSLGQVGLTFDPSGQGGGGGYNLSTFAGGGAVSQPQAAPGIAGLNAGNMGFMHPAMGGVSSGEKLREIDIINSYFKQAGVPPQQSLKILQSAVQSGVKFQRSGNTMMGFKILPPLSAQIYFFSIDKPEDFLQAVNQLLDSLKKYGVQSVYLNKIDPTIIQALESSGAAVQQSDKPEYKVMAAI